MIIFLLLIIIIILYFIKELNFINKLTNNKLNNLNNIFNYEIIPIKKLSLLYLNPFLLKSYNDIFNEIKKYNKYDPKTYLTFTELSLSDSDTNLLDWFGFVNGVIKYSIDTILKLIKKKEEISSKITRNLVYLNKYYELIYDKNKINNYKKYMNITFRKKLESNIILQNLYKLYCYNKCIFIDIIKNKNSKLNKNLDNNLDKNQKRILYDIKKYVIDNKNEYKTNLHLLNLHINNLHKIKNNKKSKSLFNKLL